MFGPFRVDPIFELIKIKTAEALAKLELEADEDDDEEGSEAVFTGVAIAAAISDIDTNKRTHILQDKHNWGKLVPNPNDPDNWGGIATLIASTLSNGAEEKYRGVEGVFIKTYQIGEDIIQVTYRIIDGVLKISDAWVK